MKVVVATRNRGKLVEVKRQLSDLGFEALSLDEAGVGQELILREEGASFEENARSKATDLHRQLGGWVLADDSGLEVDALEGAPGVHSARYASSPMQGASRDQANTDKLLHALGDVPPGRRTARFVCVVALLGPSAEEMVVRGTCEGVIIQEPRGHDGFGYDPVFLPNGFNRTMAELGLEEKNRISHRGQALRALCQKIRQMRWGENSLTDKSPAK